MIGKSFFLAHTGSGLLWKPAYLFRNVALNEPVCFVYVCVIFVWYLQILTLSFPGFILFTVKNN